MDSQVHRELVSKRLSGRIRLPRAKEDRRGNLSVVGIVPSCALGMTSLDMKGPILAVPTQRLRAPAYDPRRIPRASTLSPKAKENISRGSPVTLPTRKVRINECSSGDLLKFSNAAAVNTIMFAEWVYLHEARRDKMNARLYWASGPSSQSSNNTVAKFQQPKGQEGTISALNAAIASNLAVSNITPAKNVSGSVSVLLTTIRVRSRSPPASCSRPTPS